MPYKDWEKQKAYQRERAARLRAEWIAANGPCARCGSDEDPEVDHVDPSTKVTHVVWTWSRVRREAELAKCQVLCRRCHVEKTTAQREPRWQHGLTGYRYGCKCEVCRQANRESNARRKPRRVSER
jgi:5-methylcytosine-specific restriction endonuclease McrA